jgi:CheY-like chemotaxis protein
VAAVLVVEDDPDTCEAVSRYLQRGGHVVRRAASGRDALAALLNKTPDVVVLDVRLPEMDGVTFLDIIRSYLRWHRLPVVLLTAYDTGDHIDRAQELGVKRIFLKANYEMTDLLLAVNQYAREAKGGMTSAG